MNTTADRKVSWMDTELMARKLFQVAVLLADTGVGIWNVFADLIGLVLSIWIYGVSLILVPVIVGTKHVVRFVLSKGLKKEEEVASDVAVTLISIVMLSQVVACLCIWRLTKKEGIPRGESKSSPSPAPVPLVVS